MPAQHCKGIVQWEPEHIPSGFITYVYCKNSPVLISAVFKPMFTCLVNRAMGTRVLKAEKTVTFKEFAG